MDTDYRTFEVNDVINKKGKFVNEDHYVLRDIDTNEILEISVFGIDMLYKLDIGNIRNRKINTIL